MFKILVFVLMPISLFAQQLVSSFSIDTSLYDGYYQAIRGPENELYLKISDRMEYITDLIGCFHQKDTDKYDIYSFSGKVGTSTIPSSATPKNSSIYFSQYFIDSDSGWESIVWYSTSTGVVLFKVFDENGSQLLADTGEAYYGCDGQNTYIRTGNFQNYPINSCSFKVWRFRTNISSSLPQHLSKSTANMPGSMMTYLPNGGLHVNLQPSAGGTSLQIFDILGRQVFQKTIQNLDKAASFTIPASSLPNGPIVTKVNNNNGSFVNKNIPVR